MQKHPTQTAHVILRHCDEYDPIRIRTIVREGLDALELRPFGRTLVKPNIVTSGPMFEHAFTRSEFIEGVLLALKDREREPLEELAVGERCGITIPTRSAFDEALYTPMLKRLGVTRYCFEEEPQVEIRLTHKERLRDYVYTPQPVARADFFVNCPKFKAHPWTTVTFSMKNYIGIQDDRHRLIDHDHRLNEKIADLQYIVQPQFIAIDGIIAGEGRMLTPTPYRLNVIAMGNNQVAFDAMCCHIIGLDPLSVPHIRLAHERGFGPVDLAHIQLSGDVSLDEARARAKQFQYGLVRVEKYFEGTHITAYAGPPPEAEHSDYCWGGCPGAIEEAIEVLRIFDEHTDSKMPRMHVIFGAYRGAIDAKPGEQVIFIGDCANWKGTINGEDVEIPNIYRDRSTKDPHQAKHEDIYAKMIKVSSRIRRDRKKRVVRFEGCPVSVAEQILFLVHYGKLKNPYFDPKKVWTFNKAYFQWKSSVAIKRLRGEAYQTCGGCAQGKAKPTL